MRRFSTLALLLAVAAAPRAATATDDCLADAMIVFDGSGSMGEIGPDGGKATRITAARAAMHRAIPPVARLRKLGLVTYGGGPAGSCSGIDLAFPPITHSALNILAEVDALQPKGMTPLTAAVVTAAETLHYRERPATVVLVTDGNETCGGTPCATAAAMMRQARDLTIHVIGFRVAVDFFAWDNPEQKAYGMTNPVTKCLADETGGLYVTTETVDELVDALTKTLGCPVIGRL